MSERTNRAVIGDLGIDYHAMVLDHDAIAKARVCNPSSLMNFAALANH